MSRSAARARAGRDRPSPYQEITDKIIAELEADRGVFLTLCDKEGRRTGDRELITLSKSGLVSRPLALDIVSGSPAPNPDVFSER